MTRMARAIVSFACLLDIALLGHYRLSIFKLAATTTSAVIEGATKKEEFSWDKLPTRKELKWEPCYEGRECARLLVPLNYSDPNGREASIALIRKPAIVPNESASYRGPVLFNPGGPGGSGVDMVIQGGDILSTILGPQFDVVGFDPRGVGRSRPVASFFKTGFERALWGQGITVVNNSDEGIARTWARASILNQLAAETDDGYLRHINTENTARDMLSIVEAHGRSKLQYWGASYGSVLGATFACIFPDKVERLIIDGVLDAEDYYASLWLNNLLDTDKVMESFYTGCVDAGPENCAFWAPTPSDIQQNLTTLYKTIRSKPIPVRTESGYGLFDYSMLRNVVFNALYSPYASFHILAQGMAELAAGDPQTLFDIAHTPMFQCNCQDDSNVPEGLRIDATFAILCNDGDDIPADLESAEEYFDTLTKSSSWGELWAFVRLGCVGWPKFPKDHFQGPFNANTSHPILLIGNTADPVTPLWAANKMSKGFNGSVVLTQNSTGHVSLSAPSLCTMKHVRDYFVHGTVPEPGTVCQPIGSPFPATGYVLENGVSQASLITNMSPEDQEMYTAILQLGKAPGILSPLNRRMTF